MPQQVVFITLWTRVGAGRARPLIRGVPRGLGTSPDPGRGRPKKASGGQENPLSLGISPLSPIQGFQTELMTKTNLMVRFSTMKWPESVGDITIVFPVFSLPKKKQKRKKAKELVLTRN